TYETVATETPARSATCLMVAMGSARKQLESQKWWLYVKGEPINERLRFLPTITISGPSKGHAMNVLNHLIQDIRQGVRQLGLNPGFTAVAALSLALGIGANTAIFELINALRLRPLPVTKPQELVYLNFAPNSMRSGNYSTRSAIFSSKQWELLR